MSERHDAARYEALQDKSFALRPPQGADWVLELQLDSVRELASHHGLPCYSLLLGQYDGDAYAPQGLYRLVHKELGEQHVLVVPVGGQGKARMRYEIVFN